MNKLIIAKVQGTVSMSGVFLFAIVAVVLIVAVVVIVLKF